MTILHNQKYLQEAQFFCLESNKKKITEIASFTKLSGGLRGWDLHV